jgi:multiple sugar transport system substrate-binding protein
MASEGMKGFQEYMVNPDRRDKILERLEKVRQRVYK